MTTNRSVWQATATIPEYDEIDRDQQCDVLVVGGGIIGLTTALYLQQEGTDVVLLEARRIGARTSGNANWPEGHRSSIRQATCSAKQMSHGISVCPRSLQGPTKPACQGRARRLCASTTR